MSSGRPGATSRSAAISACRSSICRRPPTARVHVIECSSYQIDLAPSLAPTVGLLINITPDHLDRHGDLAGYAAIKERLVAQCRDRARRRRRRAVPRDRRPAEGARRNRRVVAVSGGDSPLADVFVAAACVSARERAEPPIDLRGARALRGAHNGQNAAFAYAAARALGVQRDADRAGVRDLSRASRTGWRKSAGAAACCSSTIRRRPTPTPPRRRCCRFATSTGSSAASRRRAASSRCVRSFPRVAKAYLIGEATRGLRRDARRRRRLSSAAERSTTAIEAAARDALRLAARRSRSCCCRRPARRSTSSPISRRAATRSAPRSQSLLNGEG